jgi:hypothetical protein
MAKSYCLYDLETDQFFYLAEDGTTYRWGNESRIILGQKTVNSFISSEKFKLAIETFIGFCQYEGRYLKEYIKEYGDRLVFVQYVQSGVLASNFENCISLKNLYDGGRL